MFATVWFPLFVRRPTAMTPPEALMVELVAWTVPPNVERTPRFVLAASAALNVEFDAVRSAPRFATPVDRLPPEARAVT